VSSPRADELIDDARTALTRATDACADHPEVLHAGFVADAAKEVAEAVLSRAAIAGEPLPDAAGVGVDEVAWLHGLAETVGELRRASLDHVRAERIDEAERLLGLMQEILSALASIDVPDGLSRGLRRATDAGRAITERTRGDLTTAVGQRRLREALDAHRAALEATDEGASRRLTAAVPGAGADRHHPGSVRALSPPSAAGYHPAVPWRDATTLPGV
jgi:translin